MPSVFHICLYFHVFISIVVPFVPIDFVPITVSRQFSAPSFWISCPFEGNGNPPPYCTWRRIDSNNITHEIQVPGPNIILSQGDTEFCSIRYIFTENDNGLYQCTGHNVIGNTTYTFPEPFIVESELIS